MEETLIKDNMAERPEATPSEKAVSGDRQIRVRLRFSKTGPMKFIGHLDVMRYFQKLFRRSGIDIAYTTGFHPHQIMSFANPLGVGIESVGEYMDIAMRSEPDLGELIRVLNAENVEGFEILDAVILPEGTGKGMAEVAGADYLVTLKGEAHISRDELKGLVSELMKRDEILIEKKTKKGIKSMDIKEGIRSLSVEETGAGEGAPKDEEGTVFMSLSAGSVLNIRPEQVLKAVFEYGGRNLPEFSYSIRRLEQYDSAGKTLLGENPDLRRGSRAACAGKENINEG